MTHLQNSIRDAILCDSASTAQRLPRFDFDAAVAFLRNPRNNDQACFLAAFQALADNMHRVAELSDSAMVTATIGRLIRHGLIRAATHEVREDA